MGKNSKKKSKSQKKHKDAASAKENPLENGDLTSNQLKQQQPGRVVAATPASVAATSVEPRATALPSATKQRAIIKQLMQQADAHGLQVGDKCFVIAVKWWERWCQYVRYEDDEDAVAAKSDETKALSIGAGAPPNKINNLPLLQLSADIELDELMGAPLRPQLKEGYHYALVPSEAWEALIHWYGGGPAIGRFVVQVGDPTLGNAFKRVDVYPELADQDQEEPQDGEQDVENQKKEATTAASQAVLQRKPSGSSSSIPKICGACHATEGSLKRCGSCQLIWYCGGACQMAHWKFHKSVCRASCSAEDKEAAIQESIADERRGKMGLRNLGNTCFMNSALQCLSHVEILTQYFVSNKFKRDLNCDNVLGTGGNLANEYDALLKELWFGSSSSMAPSGLKRAIGRFAPQFSGFQQHDSQELLAYLLDGLHEDLNRVKHKPYTEVKESDGQQDDAEVADEAWQRHLLRNNSIFVDHVQGQFKSTVVCPICSKVSITFDPFNCVQLELPTQQTRRMEAIVVPRGKPMERFYVEVPKKGSVVSLKRAVSKLCGIPPTVLIAVDIYQSILYRVIGDSERLARLRDDDRILLYQVDPPEPRDNDDEPPQIYYGFLYHRVDSALKGDPLLFTYFADTTCEEMHKKWSDMIAAHVAQSGSSSPIPPEVLSPCVFLSNREGGFMRPEPVPMSSSSRFMDYATLQPGDASDGIAYVSVAWSTSLLSSPTAPRPDLEFVLDHGSMRLKHATSSDASGGDQLTLQDCLRNFTKPETLDQANLWYCGSCKEHRQARKTMEIWKLPDVLIISLKRFEYRNEVLRDKLDAFVDFPLDDLDMSPFCLQPSEDPQRLRYDLFAVSNHYGGMGFGHYTAFARNWQNGGKCPGWHSFDDSQVSPVMAGQVKTNAAYILFYKRRHINA